MPGPYDESKHPRGYHGRFTGGPGRSSNAHAMRVAARPRPEAWKIEHAVAPSVATRPRNVVAISGGYRPVGD